MSSVLVKGMSMPKECHGCRFFYFNGTSCTEPKYYLDARCKLVESGQDWYGKDSRGGWVGESIEHIPGWSGSYPHKHCIADGTLAKQCPLVEVKTPHGDLIDSSEIRWVEHHDSDGNLSKYMVAYSDEMPQALIEAEGRT